VRGGSGTLSRLAPTDIIAVLDLHGAQPGQRLFHLTPDQVPAPFGVEVVQVTPTTIALMFEHSSSKLVPILPAVDGKPAPGFVVGKITSDPPNVEIVGAETAVKRAAAALTESVSVAGARDHVRATATVGVLDSALRLKTSRTAIVDVQILPAPLERVLKGLPVHWQQLSPNLMAEFVPATVDVTVRGSREELARLGLADVHTWVDLTGVGAGEYSLPVRAEAAHDAGVTHVEPATVRVRIIRDKS